MKQWTHGQAVMECLLTLPVLLMGVVFAWKLLKSHHLHWNEQHQTFQQRMIRRGP